MMEVHFGQGVTHSGIDYTITNNGGKPAAHQYNGSERQFLAFMVAQYSAQIIFIRNGDIQAKQKNARAFSYITDVLDPSVAHDADAADIFTRLLEILK